MRGSTTTRTDSGRGVTDLVAFTLTFSIIVGSVGVLYVSGFDTIEEFRDREQLNTADRGMQSVAATLEDVHRESVPGRTIQFGVDGGQLDRADSELVVEVNTTGGSVQERVSIGTLVYRRSGYRTEIAYAGGAVFREQRQGRIVRREPTMSCSGDAAIVSLIRLENDVSISRPGSVSLAAEHAETRVRYPGTGGTATDADNVSVDVSGTRYPEAWGRYFDSSDNRWQGGGGVYYCEDVERVFVRGTTIRLGTAT